MIIGINLRKIEGEVKKVEKIPGDLTVNSTPTIKNIEAKNVDVLGIKNAVIVEFEFETTYEPDIGKIRIEGEVLYKTDDAKEFADEWKKSKKISEKIAVPIINAIFRRCLLKVMNMAEDLQLPTPIRFPAVIATEGKKDKKK